MPTGALLLALAAAFVHAGWNVLLARERDTQSATAVALAIGVVLFAPLAALSWELDAAALPFVAASSALELIYVALLATAYSKAEMSFVYPIARGSAPVLVLAVSVVALGVALSVTAVAGVLLIGAGVLLVRGLRQPGRPADLALALTIGACIAGYTLVDEYGLEHGSPLAYLEAVFAVTAVAYLAAVWRQRGTATIRAAVSPTIVLAGAGYVGSYALTLAAMSIAPAAAVAAVRESSVLIAAGLAAVALRERLTPPRVLGAALVVGGIACIAFG